MDTAAVASSIRFLHSLEHDGAIVAGSVPHQSYTVLGASHGCSEFGVTGQQQLLLEGKAESEIAGQHLDVQAAQARREAPGNTVWARPCVAVPCHQTAARLPRRKSLMSE